MSPQTMPDQVDVTQEELIREAARLIAPGEGEAVFYIRVGGPYTQCAVKAADGVDPHVVVTAAMDVLAKEFASLDACPVHRQASVQKARADALEEAAKVADEYASPLVRNMTDAASTGDTIGQAIHGAASLLAQSIATAIRSLTEREVSR